MSDFSRVNRLGAAVISSFAFYALAAVAKSRFGLDR